MAIEIFSIVIVIAIGEMPVVAVPIASVAVRALPDSCSAVIDEMVAAPNSGSATALKAAGRTITTTQTPGTATVATAGDMTGTAAGATTAAAAATAKRGAASATAAPTSAAPAAV